jgi:hypothetical protein
MSLNGRAQFRLRLATGAAPRVSIQRTCGADREPSALLASSFGVVALVLAAIGLFGVIGTLVRDRMREFGIGRALGAPPGHVRAGSLLFGVTPTDPLALGGACLVASRLLWSTSSTVGALPSRVLT